MTNDTGTLTLTDFLLARIAEDEASAGATPMRETFRVQARDVDTADAITAHATRHDPARVLAECAAKRRIVELLADYEPLPADERVEQRVTLRWACESLAAVYADHPDYREEWRP